jgi:hypothetical protein
MRVSSCVSEFEHDVVWKFCSTAPACVAVQAAASVRGSLYCGIAVKSAACHVTGWGYLQPLAGTSQ